MATVAAGTGVTKVVEVMKEVAREVEKGVDARGEAAREVEKVEAKARVEVVRVEVARKARVEVAKIGVREAEMLAEVVWTMMAAATTKAGATDMAKLGCLDHTNL